MTFFLKTCIGQKIMNTLFNKVLCAVVALNQITAWRFIIISILAAIGLIVLGLPELLEFSRLNAQPMMK